MERLQESRRAPSQGFHIVNSPQATFYDLHIFKTYGSSFSMTMLMISSSSYPPSLLRGGDLKMVTPTSSPMSLAQSVSSTMSEKMWDAISALLALQEALLLHVQKIQSEQIDRYIRSTPSYREKGKMPHWCSTPCPVDTSNTRSATTASMATRPFHVSALFVQPHSQTATGAGSSLRCVSYVAKSSSTFPKGTSDCTAPPHTHRQ